MNHLGTREGALATAAAGTHGKVARGRSKGRVRQTTVDAGCERAVDAKVELGLLPYLLGYTMRRAHQMIWRSYVGVIGEKKLRPGLFSLLVLTEANPGICQIDLGTHLGIDKASMVALLDQLERAGLIERRRSTRDRRRQGISLTPTGTRELAGMTASVRQLERRMASRYTKTEMKQLLELLHRLYS